MKKLCYAVVFLFLLFDLPLVSAPPASDGPYDRITGAMMMVDYAHHEIHSGSHYFAAHSAELGSGASQTYLLETGGTASTTRQVHLTFDADGSAVTQFDFYEGSDRSGVATAAVVFNSNRSYTAATSTVLMYSSVSGGSTDGTLLWRYKGGASSAQSKTPSGASREDEFILKAGTKYILRVISGTAANLTNVQFHWYEHTPKE